MIIILECGLLYSILIVNHTEIFYHNTLGLNYYIGLRYFINFINFSLLFSNIAILICRFRDFSYKPEFSEKTLNIKEYKLLYYLIVLLVIVNLILDIVYPSYEMLVLLTILLTLLLVLYIRKPIKHYDTVSYVSIPERIMNYFIILTLLVLITNMFIIVSPLRHMILEVLYSVSANQQYMIFLLLLMKKKC